MFARVQTLHHPVEKLEELAALGREQLPQAAEFAGFRGFYFLIDRGNDKALVISLWESEEDLRQLEAGNTAVRERTAERTGIAPPPSEIFEVALQTTRQA